MAPVASTGRVPTRSRELQTFLAGFWDQRLDRLRDLAEAAERDKE